MTFTLEFCLNLLVEWLLNDSILYALLMLMALDLFLRTSKDIHSHDRFKSLAADATSPPSRESKGFPQALIQPILPPHHSQVSPTP
jgi:hypothetical protein